VSAATQCGEGIQRVINTMTRKMPLFIIKFKKMKILIIGFIALFSWASLSTHIYVCKIKGLCNEQSVTQIAPPVQKDIIAEDTSSRHPAPGQAVIPENMVIHFRFDKSDFNSDAATEKYFSESNEYMGQNSHAMLIITGYTDSVGSDSYNQALGYRRAQSLQAYFESKKMSADKIIRSEERV
jgi:hypothetical protein